MVQAYQGVPLSLANDTDAVKSKPRTAGPRSTMEIIAAIAGVVGSVGLLGATFVITIGPRLRDHPTLSPGGGRDWLVDVEGGTIASKHHPHLALGSFALDPLALTHRDTSIPEESGLLMLPPETLAALRAGEPVPARDLHLEAQFSAPVRYGDWDVLLTGATNANVGPRSAETPDVSSGDEGLGFVTYVDDNFLMLDSEYALDVSFAKMEEGNSVHFLKASDRDGDAKTLQYGGARDWALNDDGTVSPKGHPGLALGRGKRNLMLIDEGAHPGNVWKFPEDQLAGLLRGEAMDLRASDAGIGEKYRKEREYKGWRYIESQVTRAEDAVQVRYVADNYLALEGRAEEEALVLDVSFWKMEEFNSVNFVGGDRYAA